MTAILLLLAVAGLAVAGALSLAFLRSARHTEANVSDRDAVNLSIAEENRLMLSNALLSQEESEIGDLEVDIALLEDVREEPIRISTDASSWHLIFVAILIPIFAFVLYWVEWGRPGTVLLQEAVRQLNGAMDEAATVKVVDLLEAYVDLHPDDAEAWTNLMSLQLYSGNYEGFRSTHKAAEIEGHVSSFGDSLYLLDAFRQRRIDLLPYDLQVRDRLRKSDENAQAVALIDAIEHTERGDIASANRAWEDILSQRDVFQLHPMARFGQRATRVKLVKSTHVHIAVDISLEQIYPDKNWLFVYARTAHNQSPLAVVRRPLNGLRRFELILDDSVAMQPTQRLSDASHAVVTARLSATPDALEQIGDLIVSSDQVSVGGQPRVQLQFGPVRRLLTVSIASDEPIGPFESVYIIVRKRFVREPPLAVRRVFGSHTLSALEITLADAMMPVDNELDVNELEVLARLSRHGMAIARPGDVESAAVPFEEGASVVLALNRTVDDETRD